MKMFKPIIISLIIILGSLFIYSCNPNKIFEKHVDIEDMQWAKSDTKSFEVEIDDIHSSYTLSVAIRYIEGCPYEGVPVNISWKDKDDNGFSQTKSIIIRDEDLNYQGSVVGNIYDIVEPVITDQTFETTGTYHFEVSHYSDYDPMILIQEVGLIVEKEK